MFWVIGTLFYLLPGMGNNPTWRCCCACFTLPAQWLICFFGFRNWSFPSLAFLYILLEPFNFNLKIKHSLTIFLQRWCTPHNTHNNWSKIWSNGVWISGPEAHLKAIKQRVAANVCLLASDNVVMLLFYTH